MSRRGFLKGMVKTTAAAVLANVIKFVPEAQGVLAKGVKDNPGPLVEELAGTSLNEAVKAVRAHRDGEAVWQHLLGKGYGPREENAWAVRVSNGEMTSTLVKVPFIGPSSQQNALLIFGFGNGQTKAGAGFYSGKPTNIDVYAIENGQVIQESQIRKIANGAFQIDFAAGKKSLLIPLVLLRSLLMLEWLSGP